MDTELSVSRLNHWVHESPTVNLEYRSSGSARTETRISYVTLYDKYMATTAVVADSLTTGVSLFVNFACQLTSWLYAEIVVVFYFDPSISNMYSPLIKSLLKYTVNPFVASGCWIIDNTWRTADRLSGCVFWSVNDWSSLKPLLRLLYLYGVGYNCPHRGAP